MGNPKLPSAVTDHWGWKDIPQAEQEATMVAELLQSQVLVGSLATKEQVLNQIQEAECVHFATHVSWKLSSLVLSPAEVSHKIKQLLYVLLFCVLRCWIKASRRDCTLRTTRKKMKVTKCLRRLNYHLYPSFC